jgi:hypothetical protein
MSFYLKKIGYVNLTDDKITWFIRFKVIFKFSAIWVVLQQTPFVLLKMLPEQKKKQFKMKNIIFISRYYSSSDSPTVNLHVT